MIYAVDVGSTLSGRDGVAFAWCRVSDAGGVPVSATDISALADSLGEDLRSGQNVALGLEAPLFIPVPQETEKLSRGRENEGNRSWAAPAGGYVASLGVHQTAWLLRELHKRCGDRCELTVDPARWSTPNHDRPLLFCWEAFVSGPAHTDHSGDAATAAMYFQAHQYKLTTAVTAESPLSLFGAAVLWSGWSNDITWLHRSLLVLRPLEPWQR